MNKNHFLVLLAFVLLFFSCSEEYILPVPKERTLLRVHEINAEPVHSIRYVKVYSEKTAISIDNLTKSWCNAKFYTSPGTMDCFIAITISDNDTGEKRSGKITVSEGTRSEDIIIDQEYFRTGEFRMLVIPDEENRVSFYMKTFGAMIDWNDSSDIEDYKNYEYYQPDYYGHLLSGIRIHYIEHQYADREPRDIKVIC